MNQEEIKSELNKIYENRLRLSTKLATIGGDSPLFGEILKEYIAANDAGKILEGKLSNASN